MRVSIITVAFNSEKYIESALLSISAQTYPDIEHIVIDGGSNDGTLQILNRFKDKIAKLVTEPDNGIYDAMNKGLSLATGDIIGFLNSDDVFYDSSAVKNIVDCFKSKNTDCVYGDLIYVKENDLDSVVRYWKSSKYIDNLFISGWHPPHPTFYAKRSVFKKFGSFFLDFKISADYEMMLRFMAKNNVKSTYIPSPLVRMRIGGESNKSIKNIIIANIECYRAWHHNGLYISPFIMFRKPFSKVKQFFLK